MWCWEEIKTQQSQIWDDTVCQSLLTSLPHVLETDNINCHLGWNGGITDCDIADVNTIFPNIFNTECSFIDFENRPVINRTKADGLNDY